MFVSHTLNIPMIKWRWRKPKQSLKIGLACALLPMLFFGQVLDEYQSAAPNLDAFIFCMSTGLTSSAPPPQDMLSQWRAYGQDGRGICLTFDGSDLSRLVANTPGLRLNPVIYNRTTQKRFVDEFLIVH